MIYHLLVSGEFDKGHFDVLEALIQRQSRLDKENTVFFVAGHTLFKKSIQSNENQAQDFIDTLIKIAKKHQLTKEAVASHHKKRGKKK